MHAVLLGVVAPHMFDSVPVCKTPCLLEDFKTVGAMAPGRGN